MRMVGYTGVHSTDDPDVIEFVIVGGGVAGLRAAIGLAPAGRVVVLTKAEPAESNTGYAQGGVAAAKPAMSPMTPPPRVMIVDARSALARTSAS